MKRSLFGVQEFDSKPSFVVQYSIPRLVNEKEVREAEIEYNQVLSNPSISESDLAASRRDLIDVHPVYTLSEWTPVPQVILERCVSFEYTDDETMDSLQLKFSNKDMFLFYGDPRNPNADYAVFKELMRAGTLLRCKFGYDNFTSSWRYTKVLTYGGVEEVSIIAYELILARFVKQGIPAGLDLENKSLKEIVMVVGQKFFDLAREKYDDSSFVIEELLDPGSTSSELIPLRPIEVNIQDGANILGFLQELAESYGYQCWLEDEAEDGDATHYVLFFKPRDFLQSATWKFSYMVDLPEDNKNVSDFIGIDGTKANVVYGGPIIKIDEPTCETRDKTVYTQLQEIDPITGETVTARFRYSDPTYNESGETTFITRHFQDIHGVGGAGSLGSQFYDLHFIFSETGQDDVNKIEVGTNPKEDPEISKLTRYKSFLLAIFNLDHFPLVSEFQTLLATFFQENETQEMFDAIFGELDINTYYGQHWLAIGSLKSQLVSTYFKIRNDLRELKNSARIQRESQDIERGEVVVANSGKELMGKLFGKNFREMNATLTTSIKVIGNPDIKARQVCEVVGTIAYDTKWYHLKAIHTIDSNGYFTKIPCISNSTVFSKDKRISPEHHPVMVKNRLLNVEQKQEVLQTAEEELQVNTEMLEKRNKEHEELGKLSQRILETVTKMSDLNKQVRSDDNEIVYNGPPPGVSGLMSDLTGDVAYFLNELANFNLYWGEFGEDLMASVNDFPETVSFYFSADGVRLEYLSYQDSKDDKNVSLGGLVASSKSGKLRWTFAYQPLREQKTQTTTNAQRTRTQLPPANFDDSAYAKAFEVGIIACKQEKIMAPNGDLIYPGRCFQTIRDYYDRMRSFPGEFGLAENTQWSAPLDDYKLLRNLGVLHKAFYGLDSLKLDKIRDLPSTLGITKLEAAFMCASNETGKDFLVSVFQLTFDETKQLEIMMQRYLSSNASVRSDAGQTRRSSRGGR